MQHSPSRRRFCQSTLALLAAATWPGLAAKGADASGASVEGRWRLNPRKQLGAISESLYGFSYETAQLLDPRFFSADNHALIALFRQLGPHGVLRIGGNTSDFTLGGPYRPSAPWPVLRDWRGKAVPPITLKPEALQPLAAFLRATGWKLVFGVNLKIDLPEMAVELARAVQNAVGDDLLAVQIGNEPNNFFKTYADYHDRWQRTANALRQAMPDLPIAGPDTGANTDWVLDFAHEQTAHPVFLSRHYYRGGAPHGSISELLSPDNDFYAEVASIHAQSALPFRLTEVNSYYLGGQLGVSNTLAAALWGGDFMLAMASRGVAGIHFHGGSLTAVETSLGNAVHPNLGSADAQARRDSVSARYAPIAGNVDEGFSPLPLYYGMLLASRFAGANLMESELQTGNGNVTAYAAQRDRQWLLAIFNKEQTRACQMRIEGLPPHAKLDVVRLQGPAPDDVHHVSLGRDSDAIASGDWQDQSQQQLESDARGDANVALPACSAVLLRLKST
ncbi:hypothetical protein [Dyella psychrodurans]|uniref:Beta-glucuronidase C-terminal domain-containing protein n=1 Tax=Dyella psychrodurans TaxID=1927960 RepID=A0A370X157_9GAMM|nr:hypothetical protein [Dyella psychrodurans]RDS82010.1 hypothetical protein DWU99_16510 [Dyella psychrodurans]